MTPEEQRIAIATVCGYIGPRKVEITHYGCNGQYDLHNPNKVRLPDYLNDLNATKEAEDTLTDEEFLEFARLVIHSKIPCPDGTVDDWDLFEEYGWAGLLRATAAQRAEAFLKTKGLWKD